MYDDDDDDDGDDDELELIRSEISVEQAARCQADQGWIKEIIRITGSRHILGQLTQLPLLPVQRCPDLF